MFNCCTKPEDSGNNHTIQVKVVETRFDNGSKIVGQVSQNPAMILTPDIRVQNETIWRSNVVAQPIHVVFTYSNRANEVQSSLVPSQQMQLHGQQPSALRQTPIVASEIRPGTTHTMNLTELRTASIQTSTAVKELTFRQRSINQHMVGRREEQRQSKQQQPIYMQNSNNFGVTRTVEITHYSQPLNYKYTTNEVKRVESPASIPTPIDALQRENFTSLTQHVVHRSPKNIHSPPHNIEMHSQRIQSATIPIYGPNHMESPITGTNNGYSKAEETPSTITKKKTSPNKPKKTGKGDQKRNPSHSSKTDISKKNKQMSVPHTSLTGEKRHTGLSSARKMSAKPSNHLSDRLLEHRPCGRRHCTACQFKKKSQVSASTTKLKIGK